MQIACVCVCACVRVCGRGQALAAQHSFSVGAQKRLPGFDLAAQRSFWVRMRTGAPVMCTPAYIGSQQDLFLFLIYFSTILLTVQRGNDGEEAARHTVVVTAK